VTRVLAAVGHILAVAAAIATWSLAGKALMPRSARTAERCLFWSSALALGAGTTAVLVTAAVALGVFGHRAAWSIAGAVLALGVAGLRVEGPRRTPGPSSAAAGATWRRLPLAAVGLVGLGTLVATLVATLAPPSSMDATVYHLRVAREFLRTGHWTEIPEVVQSYQPLYVQMLFAEGLGLYDEVFAALMHWALGLGAVLAAGAWSRRLGGSALLGMAIFGMAALFTWESTSAFIDLALTLFASLGLLWATTTPAEPGATWLAAIFAGLAAGSKLTGGVAAIQTAVLVAVFASGSSSLSGASSGSGARRALRSFGFVVAVSFALALPWYLRNVAFTGNPVFPVGNLWLGLPVRPLALTRYGYGSDLLHLLTSPVDIVWRGDAFDKGWALGPAYLALVPVGLWVTWRTKVGRAAAGVLLSWWVMWFFSSPQTRLLLPILPIAAALASVGAVATLTAPERWLRRSGVALLVSAGGLGAIFALVAVKTYGPVALGRESRADFLTRMSWHFPAFEAANARLGPGARVAVVGADNLFYLRADAEAIREPATLAALRERGFTHVLDIRPCARPPGFVLEPSARLWQGRYRLRASRMGGGEQAAETCADLATTGPAPPPFLGYAPFSPARSP